eukprot:scaffold21812_cov110-Isochrysis_galbana.AAC.7
MRVAPNGGRGCGGRAGARSGGRGARRRYGCRGGRGGGDGIVKASADGRSGAAARNQPAQRLVVGERFAQLGRQELARRD